MMTLRLGSHPSLVDHAVAAAAVMRVSTTITTNMITSISMGVVVEPPLLPQQVMKLLRKEYVGHVMLVELPESAVVARKCGIATQIVSVLTGLPTRRLARPLYDSYINA